MFVYPHIDPVIVKIGPLSVHWYGMMYALSFLTGWWLLRRRAQRSNGVWNEEQVSDLIFYVALGVVLGGRLGYMIFYDLPHFISSPMSVFHVWDGGMAFHGGLIGVLLAMLYFRHRHHKAFFETADFIAPIVPIGLGAGRIGNFINGELWGRVTDVPWAMVYPHVDQSPRHPSEIYEFLLEGVLLFILMWLFARRPRPRAAVSGMFSLLYGLFRIFAEFFRQPDPQYGYLAFGWLTMGQVLSVPMVLVGLYLLWYAYQQPTGEQHAAIP